MVVHATYSEARANLARLWNQAIFDRETVIISRRGADDIAMIAADELASLRETVHLLRSPANATRLLSALQRALRGEGETTTVDQLRTEADSAEAR